MDQTEMNALKLELIRKICDCKDEVLLLQIRNILLESDDEDDI